MSTYKKCKGGYVKKLPDGGNIVGKRGMMKARMALEAEFGNPAAKRMTSPNPKTYTFIGNEPDDFWRDKPQAGELGTHYIANEDNYVIPMLQDKNNKLRFIQHPSYKDKEAMKFQTPEDAEYFAEHYKEIAPMMKNFNNYKKGGRIPKYTYGIDDIATDPNAKYKWGNFGGNKNEGLAPAQPKLYDTGSGTGNLASQGNPAQQEQGAISGMTKNAGWIGQAIGLATMAGDKITETGNKHAEEGDYDMARESYRGAQMFDPGSTVLSKGADYRDYLKVVLPGTGQLFGSGSEDNKIKAYRDAAAKKERETNEYYNSLATNKLTNLKSQGFNSQGSYSSLYKKGGYISKMANGGMSEPDYEVENNEVVEGNNVQLEGQQNLASNMTRAVGATHENGGIEGTGGERVYSDRIPVSQNLISYLSVYKITIKPKSTYADVATKLGKLKGKYEEKLESHNPLPHNTGKAMTERINNLIEIAFQEQEFMKKQKQQAVQYAKYGGYLKKFDRGGGVVKNRYSLNPATQRPFDGSNVVKGIINDENIFTKNYIDPYSTENNGFNVSKVDVANESLDLNNPLTRKQLHKSNNTVDNSVNPPIVSYGKSRGFTSTTVAPVVAPTSPSAPDVPVITTGKSNFMGKTGNVGSKISGVGKNMDWGQLINAGVYASNLSQADRQKTHIKRDVAQPTYMRNVNMLPYMKNKISGEARAAGVAVDRMSGNVQDTFARKSAINVNSMEALNSAGMNQAQLDMQRNNQNTAIGNDYGNRLAGAKNEDALDELQGNNAKLANRQGANNAFLQGVMGNVYSKRMYDVEREKNEISRISAGRNTDLRSDFERHLNNPNNLTGRHDFSDSEINDMIKHYTITGNTKLATKAKALRGYAKGGYINKERKVGYNG